MELARTSWFSALHVLNPITGQQFMPQCEDALLFQYWDVKLHTRPLMHSGNHSSLLNCQEQDCQRTLSQGKGNQIRPHSLSLSLFFWPWLLSRLLFSLLLRSSFFLSSLPQRPLFVACSFMAGRLMTKSQFPDSWHLPGDSPWHVDVVGFP